MCRHNEDDQVDPGTRRSYLRWPKKINLNRSDPTYGKREKHSTSAGRHFRLTMSSGRSFISCGRGVDGVHFPRIGDVGTRSIAVGDVGWMPASGPVCLDNWPESRKGNSASWTAPLSRCIRLGTELREALKIKQLDSQRAATIRSSRRRSMKQGMSWLCSSSLVSALRRRRQRNCCPSLQKP